MASTASPSLRLELMGTGDQAGTWGTTTNTNLGTLLEQAITGYVAISKSGITDLTLTNTDYVSNQNRNAVIEITGTPGAPFNVIVPLANKLWVFKNSSNGAMTVKASTGTGTVVPVGASAWLFCDGTNVRDALGYYFTSTSTAFSPTTSDAQALGTTALMWSDLFLASGGVINFNNGNVTLTHSAGALTSNVPLTANSFIPSSSTAPTNGLYLPAANTVGISASSAGRVQITSTATSPVTSDGNALGTTALQWSDLFLATGGVINWANGDITVTGNTNALAFAGASSGYSFDANVSTTGTFNKNGNDITVGTATFIIDGGGSTITTGSKGFLQIPFACTVNNWTLVADQSGSIVIDVKRSTYSGFPTTSSIAGTEKPTLSSVQKNQDLSLTTWTTSIAAGDILEFNVDSVTTVQRVTLSLQVTRA